LLYDNAGILGERTVSQTLDVIGSTQGDILFRDVSVWNRLAKDTNATRYLSNTGASNNPAWAQINLANGVTGTIQAANFPALTGDVTTPGASLATTIATAAVTYAKIQNVAALSVFGRSANSAGVGADISAAAASGAVLRESGSTIGFGTIATAGITDANVTYAKIQNVAALSVFGRASNTSGVGADITGAANQVLRVSGTTLAFGAVDISTAMVTGRLPFANLTQGTARSVLGVAGNATADVASIQGTTDQILRIDTTGTALAFGSINLAASAAVGTTVLGATNGGTAQSTWTLGDLLYGSGTNTLAKLAGNTTSTKKFLRQTGTGSVSAVPAWDTVLQADVTFNAVSSWTPALTFGGGSTGITYTARIGTYLQIGKQVIATFDITLSAKGSSTGTAAVSLPVQSDGSITQGGFLYFWNSVTFATSTVVLMINPSATTASINTNSTTAQTGVSDTAFTNTTRIIGTMAYLSN
jgi:hypothetical protein